MLCFMVIVFSANSSNSRNNSPRQAVLKSMGISALKIIEPNRTKFAYADIVEGKFRLEREKKIRLSNTQ